MNEPITCFMPLPTDLVTQTAAAVMNTGSDVHFLAGDLRQTIYPFCSLESSLVVLMSQDVGTVLPL